MAESGSKVIVIHSEGRLKYVNVDRQRELDNAIKQLASEGKKVVNIIDGPLTPFGPFGNVYCEVTILWEKQSKSDSGNIQSAQSAAQPAIHITSENFQSILTRIDLFLEDKEWDKADAYCEEALNFDATNAAIYEKKLLAELHFSNEEELFNSSILFWENNTYQKILKFGDNNIKEKYIMVSQAKKAAIEEAAKRAKAVNEKLTVNNFSYLSTDNLLNNFKKLTVQEKYAFLKDPFVFKNTSQSTFDKLVVNFLGKHIPDDIACDHSKTVLWLSEQFSSKNSDYGESSEKLSEKQSVSTDQKSGCYVATAVYGSYDCPEVWTLRRYRDDTLGITWYGRAFIHAYYAISPTIVKLFGKSKVFNSIFRPILDKKVQKLKESGVSDVPYTDKRW